MTRFYLSERADAALGAWLFASPFVLPYFAAPLNSVLLPGMSAFVVAGCLAGTIAMMGLFHHRNWEPWLGLVLGGMVIASPWVLGFETTPISLWNAVICGAGLLVAALWAFVEPDVPDAA